MIGWLVETYLQYYRRSDRQVFLCEHEVNFEKNESHIISLLKQTDMYHGTGAYHYTYTNGSKYDGGQAQVSYTLPKILNEGLVPQKDLFNIVMRTGVARSSSLTKNRLYARAYASLFHGQKKTLQYDYGPRLLWIAPVVWRVVIGNFYAVTKDLFNAPKDERTKIKQLKVKMVRGWVRSFRSDTRYTKSPWQWLSSQTDIAKNYGVVIGIKCNVVTPLTINYPNVAKDEVRTDMTLAPGPFSHIQVP